jgi:hypothetical protein
MHFYKFQPHAQSHEIHGNQVINAYANFSEHQKFLVAFSNENLFVDAAAKGHFSGYVCLLKNFSGTPAAIFVDAHQYRKINKSRRADSSEADGDIDSESKWLLHLSDASRL